VNLIPRGKAVPPLTHCLSGFSPVSGNGSSTGVTEEAALACWDTGLVSSFPKRSPVRAHGMNNELYSLANKGKTMPLVGFRKS
jgi:hypothetical protein